VSLRVKLGRGIAGASFAPRYALPPLSALMPQPASESSALAEASAATSETRLGKDTRER
jgi:hypothetical protein